MAVVTVQGPIAPENLGFTLMHEHVFLDLSFYVTGPNKVFPSGPWFDVSDDPLSLATLGRARRNQFSIRDNLRLDDAEAAVSELINYRSAGGVTLVDVTPRGAGRMPERLRKVSRLSGVNIVAATGYYQRETYPADVDTRRVDELAREMLRDLTTGIDETGVRAGIIGELGASPEPDGVEMGVFEAAAIAHGETDAAIVVHPCGSGDFILCLLEFLAKRGVNPAKVIISHLDCGSDFDWDYIHSILAAGACVSFDNFGFEHPRDWKLTYPVNDLQRARAVAGIVSEGYTSQLVVSSDVCLKMQLRAYGGWGYGHVLENALPYLRAAGISENQLHEVFTQNPSRLLSLSV